MIVIVDESLSISVLESLGLKLTKAGRDKYRMTLRDNAEKPCTRCGKEEILVSGLAICLRCNANLISEIGG